VIFKFPSNIAPPTISADKQIKALTERQEKIIAILMEVGNLPSDEIMSRLHEDITARTLRRDLKTLEELNLVELRGTTHTATWCFIKK